MSGLYSDRDLRTVCGMRIHESPHNPSLTGTLIYKKTTSTETLLSGEEQIRTSIGHILYQGQATQVTTGRLREI